MTIGIILAGGKGSRLGPLAAQISKALVPIGNRPQVVNQVEQLRLAGADRIIVVTGKDTDWQILGLIERAGLKNVETRMQFYPEGPAPAIKHALSFISPSIEEDVVIIFSDTVISEPIPQGDWFGVGYPPAGEAPRSYCFFDRTTNHFIDSESRGIDEAVTIGISRFGSLKRLRVATFEACYHENRADTGEVGMAPLFERYFINGGINAIVFQSWQDVGDLAALAAARRTRFIARASHTLDLHGDGTITKGGVSQQERDFMDGIGEFPIAAQTLFPTVYATTDDTYTMEFVDLPTLAELWLYWPGSGKTWAGIVGSIIERLQKDLWVDQGEASQQQMTKFFGGKAYSRLLEWNAAIVDDKLVEQIAEACEIIGPDVWVRGHGDLNFTNILYSLNTGNFKLLDPRGGKVPQIYEYAKLAYSPVFSAITHDLFVGPYLLPERVEEIKAITTQITKDVDPKRLTAAIALTLLAACPLHPQKQASILFSQGRRMLHAVTR